MGANVPATGRPVKKRFVEPYDFRHPKLFSKEIMRNLRSIHDVLARNLSRILSSALRQKVDVWIGRIDQISTSEFIQNLENPSVIYLLTMQEENGEVIIVLPTPFCLHLIERQSGGQGNEFLANRTLTTIEEKIVNRIMKSVNREIVSAWEPYKYFRIKAATYENKSENIHNISLDPTIVARVIVETSEREVELKVSYPYSLLKEVMNDTSMSKGSHFKSGKLSEEEMESYEQTLKRASVSVRPLLGTAKLTIDELTGLKKGDVIALDQKTDDPLEVRVSGVTKMSAFPGVVQGRRAVKIFELVDEINEQELL